MRDSEIKTLLDAFDADAIECKGRVFVAQDKLLAYMAGKEISVVRLKIDGDETSREEQSNDQR